MAEGDLEHQDWLRVDARVLGQILAAQNVMFILPDEKRIAEYFSQALSGVPGVSSCSVCIEKISSPPEVYEKTCSDIESLQKECDAVVLPIAVGLNTHPLGYIVFRIQSNADFKPYLPFINNLVNYVALTLENRKQKQLIEERSDQLNAANKELESFAYSVSHDLRAPLRHINGYINLLVSNYCNELPEKGKHYADTVADSAHHMAVLIDGLLEFSRTGRAVLHREIVDMNKALNDALMTLEESYSGRKIKWEIEKLPPVQGDYVLLRQVWTNLIGNAVKYTSKRDVAEINVRAQENGEIVYIVSDNGVGFDMHYAEKLFGVFQRLHKAEEFEGTGIGLATVQRIINRHGGRIWAEAQPQKGATFYFALPADRT
jgi:signal transduction histidine kinase